MSCNIEVLLLTRDRSGCRQISLRDVAVKRIVTRLLEKIDA